VKRSKKELEKKEKMVKYTKVEIDKLAREITDLWLGKHSLKNAKKIVLAVKRNLKAEENRRKELKK